MTTSRTRSSKKVQKLMFDNKPLTRRGNMVYYGNKEDKYIIAMKTLETKQIKELTVATKVSIELQRNEPGLTAKEKIVKKAEREGLFRALEIGAIWLDDALTS